MLPGEPRRGVDAMKSVPCPMSSVLLFIFVYACTEAPVYVSLCVRANSYIVLFCALVIFLRSAVSVPFASGACFHARACVCAVDSRTFLDRMCCAWREREKKAALLAQYLLSPSLAH